MAVSGILSLAFIGLAVVSAAVSLLVHAYRRFKEIQSPKRWIAFEVLIVLPVCLMLVFALPEADVLIRSYVFGLTLQLPIYWVLAVLGVRLTIEVCLPFTRWLVASKKSISKSM